MREKNEYEKIGDRFYIAGAIIVFLFLLIALLA